MLVPIQRRSLPESVFRQLREHILEGRLAVGERLPGERELSAQLKVNRNALREALKRLEQLRLVAIQPGGSTRVLDFRATGGVELLVSLLVGEGGALRLDVAKGLAELRTTVGPDIAARAASRGGPARAAELEATLAAMEAAPIADAVALDELSLAVWRVLVEASENVVYRLLFNTMLEAWKGIQALAAPALADELRDRAGYRALVRAVVAGNEEGARRAAKKLVEKGEAGLLRLVGGREKTRSQR